MAVNKIRGFKFPTFEEWSKHSWDWTGRIGEYNCEVSLFMWGARGKENTYQLAISTHDKPTNMFAYKIYMTSVQCKSNDTKKLKEWYESAITKANDKWKNYIENNYFE